MSRLNIVFAVFLISSLGKGHVLSAEAPLVEKYLHAGQLAQGKKALEAQLASNPKDDQARFGLGALQFIRGVEHLGQSLHRYGLRSELGRRLNVPFLRLPVPANPEPQALTYPASRKILQDLIADLQTAETTLAAVRDEQVKLPLRLGAIRLDLAGTGKADTSFSTLLARYMGGGRKVDNEPELLVVFDRGDVAWLRGYCHLLMGLAEIALAHDGRELFDCTAHIFFAKVETPHQFLTERKNTRDPAGDFLGLGDVSILDLIAFVHLVRMPVSEPARMRAALGHLEQMVALSKESWKFILAGTDDDHEWIPNPRQTGIFGVPVRAEMIESWLEFLDEMELILAGKRLIPLWRGNEARGINLRRVFLEPRPFDLVLWVQGTAATPFLEKGELTKPAVWNRLLRVFGGEFVGFAIWFN
jgi:hypothetical protein